VRIACLEAQVRSVGPIGRVRAELFVRPDPRGIRVDVDVEARVFSEALPRPLKRVQAREPKRGARGT
jgi:hypothetical protein